MRDELLLRIPYYESLTIEQLRLLKKRDFFRRGKDMLVRTVPYKGRTQRTKLILDDSMATLLDAYLRHRGQGVFLFPLSTRRIREIYQSYGVTSSILLYSCLLRKVSLA